MAYSLLYPSTRNVLTHLTQGHGCAALVDTFLAISPGVARETIFQTFSPERLFSPIDSNIVNLTFAVPGTQTPALVRGFGAVYTNVAIDHTAFEYFDANGQSLGQYSVPIAAGGLSFLGVVFDQPVVARVSIAYGTVALGPDDDAENNVAVMDDFGRSSGQYARPCGWRTELWSPGRRGFESEFCRRW
jgi:hypothetical protein